MKFDNIDDARINWMRFSRKPTRSQKKCGSMEGNYQAPRDDEPEWCAGEANIEEAMRVEKIITQKLPPMMKAMIIGVDLKGSGYLNVNCEQLHKHLKKVRVSIKQSELEQYYKNAWFQVWLSYKTA